MGRCYYPSWITKVKRKKVDNKESVLPTMSTSSKDSKMDRHAIDSDRANELFNHFCSHANTMKSILAVFRLLCETLRLKPAQFPFFYPKLKARLKSWKANAIWAKLDKRSNQRTYGKGKIAAGQRILVIGAGPCGLRAAIEAQLLGAKVVVIEKRDRFSRNNVLHLWPYNITDLKGIGAKKFYGKFCAGSIDHISIRQLQCILLKVCLLLGVQVFENTSFEELIEPVGVETGWRAKITPSDHPVSHYEFDVLVGADGKRNTLHGFKRKEFRGKLAIAITVNFINRRSELESMVEEISGVAFIFNQKFFNDLNDAKGIDLENIVYYRDETHYFVMTAKKQSLLNKGVIISNEADTAKLLSQQNINQEALFEFAREAANYATNYKLPDLDFAVNHYGKPDVAMFDFTSMFQAENSCRISERHGHKLFTCLVGDSLLEPFWPTGTGCARGFFGGFDAIWSLRSLCLGKLNALEVLAERESVYRFLAQTTPENTCKDFVSYSLDPSTRYVNLNNKSVLPFQIIHLYDTDDPDSLQEMLKESKNTLPDKSFLRKKSREGITHTALLSWFQKCLESYPENLVPKITDLSSSFQDGMALCAVIHRYRPDLIGNLEMLRETNDSARNNELAFEILEHDLGIPPVITGEELARSSKPDKLTMISYLSSVYEVFSRDLPIMKRPSHPALLEDEDEDVILLNAKNKQNNRNRPESSDHNKILSIGQLVAGEARRNKKRRSGENSEDLTAGIDSLPDKENIRTKKRINRLLESSSKNHKKGGGEIRSIKKEERFKVIQEQFQGGPKRRSEVVTKYRENKRPKELRRAIGKIDKDDWNIKNIEEKLKLNKNDGDSCGNHLTSSKKDKVPKWSKAAFQDKFNIMKDKLENKSEDGRSKEKKQKKFNDIDSSLARLQKKLREGSTLETGQRGRNKVSALASEIFAKTTNGKKTPHSPENPLTERTSKKNSFAAKTGSETCHFCSKRVYVVERMSAEGKFFHRSCFRCDYCNILLRLGSYVYKRNGVVGGKFFCIPHYTETYMEKYRYRHKEDEIRAVDARRKEDLHHVTNSDWNTCDGVSITPRHKERLLSSLEAEARGTTPERAEFSVSMDSNEEEARGFNHEFKPAIMDEDEWTDRNFGNSAIESDDDDGEDTSDDSVSDLDSDTDEERETKEDEGRPLTADEARQLQREWIKRYDPGGCESSMESSDNEDEISINYEDCEYESSDEGESSSSGSSSESSSPTSEERVMRLKASRPMRNRRNIKSPPQRDSGSSTEEVGDLSSSSEDEDEKFSEFYNSELERSESNTECEFTDSEGRPNPFQKELESTKRPVLMNQSSSNKITVIKPDHVSQIISLDPGPGLINRKKFQYKTPNISDRLRKQQQVDSVSVNANVSTRRALNLKKNWASGNNGYYASSISNNNKVDTSEVDNRLKSLMDRLSNQQKLLKPGENAEPSKEMKHVLQSSMNMRNKADATTVLNSFSLKPVSSSTTVRSPSFVSYINSVPPIYKPLESEATDSAISKISAGVVSSHSSSSSTTPLEDLRVALKDEILKNENKDTVGDSKTAEATLSSPSVDERKIDDQGDNQNTENVIIHNQKDEDVFEFSTVQESPGIKIEEDDPPDLEPIVEAINDIQIEKVSTKIFVEEEDVFESCNEEEDVVAVEAVNEPIVFEMEEERRSVACRTPTAMCPVIEPPKNDEEEKPKIPPPPVVTLTEDEITRIYQERNPLERIAKINSYKQRQSSVIHDLIMSNRTSSKSPRRNISNRFGNISTSPLPPPPPPPMEDFDEHPVTNINTLDFPLIDEEESSLNNSPARQASSRTPARLPATPITDPEKFGIVRHRSNSKSTPVTPTRSSKDEPRNNKSLFSDGDSSPEKKATPKKSFMQSLSGLFSKSRVSSPETSENRSLAKMLSSSSSTSSSSGFTSPGLASKSGQAPRAVIEDDKLSPDSYRHPTLRSLSMKVSHPSTPPIPLSRKINIENSINVPSEDDEEEESLLISRSSRGNSFSEERSDKIHRNSNVPPEIVEKILKRGGPKTAKLAKIAQVKRIRRAQELQRQLEELDVARKEIENRGVFVEQRLRREGIPTIKEEDESELMQEWFQLLAEKNYLVRQEQELLVLSKQLELEDRSSKLEIELRECLFLDSRSTESVVREGEILKELLEISEAREKLQAMLEKDKKRYKKEDQDIEAQMIAKGLRITPIRRISSSCND